MQHTLFNTTVIQKALLVCSERGLFQTELDIHNYSDWCQKVPILDEAGYRLNVEQLLQRMSYENCNFSMSSASNGIPKLIPQRLWRMISPESYPYKLVETLVKQKTFTRNDRVANLFTAGGLSTLYDGCNRILEGCKTNILPIGRLDVLGDNKKGIIKLMSMLSIN